MLPSDLGDVYVSACGELTRLCPRLVPSPLWGISLANIANMSPYIADAMCSGCGDAVRRVRDWWFSLNRNGPCEVCGAPGAEIDEEWDYVVKGNEGIAVITHLRRLCRNCHLAKHQGYAKVHGLSEAAINHLARVNGVDVSTARRIVREVFGVWHTLNGVNWVVRINNDIGLPSDLRVKVEELMNTMLSMHCSRWDGWFHCLNTGGVCEKALQETLQLLKDVEDYDRLISTVEERLEKAGITVLKDELLFLINQNEVRRLLLMGRLDDDMLYVPVIGGKWMVFIRRRDIYGKVFIEIINELIRRDLHYESKTLFNPRDNEGGIPLIFYVPSFLALNVVINVANVINEVLIRYGIRTKAYFKPELFTNKSIYRGTTGLKPYIYIANVGKGD
ncbi:HNH endonuclease [Vulcanisaeta distributa]|uniref:Uncharacterized protein n=1 Tax=Vulcanisaeta distributa (strain DSM 14429 / JCM 11212 / NBRC 100878 / IC-017) TaxID=572478 RepID=E1QSE0_VULDI|nr:HNH endonuclease [Vulcanisaeta distributa]ADN49533.1 conserved hypothetical protein [Vulcanisaeta distributa DSM 14429]